MLCPVQILCMYSNGQFELLTRYTSKVYTLVEHNYSCYFSIVNFLCKYSAEICFKVYTLIVTVMPKIFT